MSQPTRIIGPKGETLTDMDFTPNAGEVLHLPEGEFEVTGDSRIEPVNNGMQTKVMRVVTAKKRAAQKQVGSGRRGPAVEG